tara:strand:- start:164 stop:577 length:414 start_codon:yes stop_codon:yes gene_type:complete
MLSAPGSLRSVQRGPSDGEAEATKTPPPPPYELLDGRATAPKKAPKNAPKKAQTEVRLDTAVYEDPIRSGCVRCAGQAAFVLVGVMLFAIVLSQIRVSGLTDMPHYADNLLYASLAHHFDDVHARLFEASPPPPPAF